jgi:small subunit ribosomal protein S18
MGYHKPIVARPKMCYFCVNGLNDIDYKNVAVVKKFTSSYSKIAPQRRSGLCATHQRKASNAIKRARFMALLPYITR